MTRWPGKLLLFGEYTVLLGGEALALPLHGLSGRWEERGGPPDERLEAWLAWLTDQESRSELPWTLDLAGFSHFIASGGRFHSAIPTGCGLGSSGALVAALADRWSASLPSDLGLRRAGLARLESFFHGNSSGLDPLVSLQGTALHLLPEGGMHELELPPLPDRLFLLDSRMPRQTAPLVVRFREDTANEGYRKDLQEHLMPQVNAAIAALSAGKEDAMGQAFRRISTLQAEHFIAMIPDPIRELWSSEGHVLKLCGAGGGGYFLGLALSDRIPDLPFPTVPLSRWTENGQR
jgi:mevalonate kinase